MLRQCLAWSLWQLTNDLCFSSTLNLCAQVQLLDQYVTAVRRCTDPYRLSSPKAALPVQHFGTSHSAQSPSGLCTKLVGIDDITPSHAMLGGQVVGTHGAPAAVRVLLGRYLALLNLLRRCSTQLLHLMAHLIDERNGRHMIQKCGCGRGGTHKAQGACMAVPGCVTELEQDSCSPP